MNKLTQTAIMAVAGGAIAGVSFLAGKREGIKLNKQLSSVSEQVGYMRALKDMSEAMVNKSVKRGQ